MGIKFLLFYVGTNIAKCKSRAVTVRKHLGTAENTYTHMGRKDLDLRKRKDVIIRQE